jgi:predicted nucleic acid-binding protein
LRFLKDIAISREYELWTGAIQMAEVLFFMRPQEERSTELFLSQFQTAPVDQRIVDTAGRFFRQWYPSHGIDINDALLAATAVETGGLIFTLNTKHYPMEEVIVKKAW